MNPFDKIIGYQRVREELEQIADIMQNREAYRKLGVRQPSGLLLIGVPGVGKTLMANSLILAANVPTFICRKDKSDGAFVDHIRDIFKRAAEKAPSIIFLDDLDKFANSDYDHSDADEFVTVQSCIDTFKEKDVFVLATVNDSEKLPRSLTRPGRFDRVLTIQPPTPKDAEEIIEHYLSAKEFVSKVDTSLLARIMNGRSCAQLETVINEAGIIAGRERETQISMEHILKACFKLVFCSDMPRADLNTDFDDDYYEDGYKNTGKTQSFSSQRKSVAYHEIGHAIVSDVLFPGSVTLVALTNGNEEVGGFTSFFPGNRLDVQWLIGSVVTSLGGMAATEHFLGNVDICCSKDLSAAFHQVMELVTQNCAYGFSYKHFGYNTSNDQKAKIETFCGSVVEKYYKKAQEILVKNQDYFHKLVNALLKKGYLTQPDIAAIREECEVTAVQVA